MRHPNGPLSRIAEQNVAAVNAEIAQEKAASLGRAGSRLMAAIEALEARPDGALELAEAREALWYYVIQREACGMRGIEPVLREYRVPREVYLRMGPRKP